MVGSSCMSSYLRESMRTIADHDQMTWVFVIMGDVYDIKRGEWHTDSHSLLSAQELWFAVFMTIL
jgi:hypothetical protein